jgi:hypothetical protein
MGHPIPAQHRSVVLRPHFNPRQALLAFAMAAVLALGAGVVILAGDADQVASTNRAAPAVQQSQQAEQALPPGTRFDGGPDEGTRGIQPQTVTPGTRFDGGPDEGTRGPQSYWESSAPRSSYQPAPAEGTKARAGGPTMNLQGGPGAH